MPPERARYCRPPAVRRAPGAVTAVRDLLSERMTDPPRLDDLALATGMGPFALPREFRDETGLPPTLARARA